MRPIWKGSLSFGLVNVPVKMFAATERKNIKFRYLHQKCHAPVEYQRLCSVCGKEVPFDEIVKGYEYESGKFVEVTKEELAKVPDEHTRQIEILDFVDISEIDPVYYDKTYYLSPEETGQKAYQLLEQTLQNKEKVAICKVVIRSKEVLGCVRVLEDILCMETMYFPDEVRTPDSAVEKQENIDINPRELEMATQLVDSLTASFDPDRYRDDYRENLMKLITAKIEGEQIEIPEAPKEDKVVNLLDALEKSVNLLEEKQRSQG